MRRKNLLTEHARELIQAPEGWQAYRWTYRAETDQFCVDGAVAPPMKHGANKGATNWRKRDRSTQRSAFFTMEEHKAWCKLWEQRTGGCLTCGGSGWVDAGQTPTGGARTLRCLVCVGSGRRENAHPVAAFHSSSFHPLGLRI